MISEKEIQNLKEIQSALNMIYPEGHKNILTLKRIIEEEPKIQFELVERLAALTKASKQYEILKLSKDSSPQLLSDFDIVIEDWILNVCKHEGIVIEELRSTTKKREVVTVRWILARCMLSNLRLTLAKIGKKISMDHASVLNANKNFGKRIKYDANIFMKETTYSANLLQRLRNDENLIRFVLSNKLQES